MRLFVPPPGLLTATGESRQAVKFGLASSEWFQLQNHVAAVLALPTDFAEYQMRYGDASSGSLMKDCFDAMHGLRRVAGRYGNPATLRAAVTADPNVMANAERPSHDVYSATLWTAQLAQQDALALRSYLQSIPEISRDKSAPKVVQGIRDLFLGDHQIVAKMIRTRDQYDLLIKELEGLEGDLQGRQEAMRTFTERSSRTRTDLNREIGDLEAKISQLEDAQDAAYQEWLALTISACIAPAVIGIVGVGIMVLLAVPTGGNSFAVGSAITGATAGLAAASLGTAASLARSKYDKLGAEVADRRTLRGKRIVYRRDLGALDRLMQFSIPASSGLIHQVRGVRDAWDQSITEIRTRVGALTVDNLASGPWLRRDAMGAASGRWHEVAQALRAFAVGSFVDSTRVEASGPLPAEDATWQRRFVQGLAASQ